MSNNQTLGQVSIHTKTSNYFLAHRVRAPGGMDFLRGSVITPPAKLSRQHSSRPINGNLAQVVVTPTARLIPRQSPRLITSTSTTTPPTKSSGPNSLRMINNVDTEYAQHEARTWNEYRSQIYHLGGHSVLEDATIPTNNMRYANISEEWTQNAVATGTQDHHEADSTSAHYQAQWNVGLHSVSANHVTRAGATPAFHNW
jgi:hypothetical protein